MCGCMGSLTPVDKDMQEQLCICVRYSTSGRNGAHPLEGTWNTSRGTMELAIEGAFEGLSVSGSRGVGGSVQGLVLADVETRSGVTFEGFYASGSDTYGHAWWWLRYCHGIGRSLACMLLRCAMCGYYQVHARVPAAVDVRR